jgi:hypothetical protein
MDETRLREQLDRLAGDAGVPDLDDRRVLGRARRRRALTGGLTALLVVAVGAAGFLGVRSVLDRPPTTLGQDPGPTDPPGVTAEGFPGLWPESDPESLAAAQTAADDGHSPLRTTAEGTAGMFATDLLGWQPDYVVVDGVETGSFGTLVRLRNPGVAPVVPTVEVTLRQLGTTGPTGVWTVVAVASPILESIRFEPGDGGTIHVSGRLALGYGQPQAVAASLLDGNSASAEAGLGRIEVTDGAFAFDLRVPPAPSGRATLLVRVPGEGGATLGAAALAVPAPVGEPAPAIHLEGAPPDVAVTAQRLLDAVLAHDLDALAELIDPNTFVHDFDDGSDPIPGWREDPTVLDVIPGVLRLPFVVQDIEGYGTFYVWPYLMKEGALDDVTEQERADLHSLGFSDAEIERMREFGSYIGPRLAIDADGLWRNYVTGGD